MLFACVSLSVTKQGVGMCHNVLILLRIYFKFATVFFSMQSEDQELVPLNVYLSTSLELLKTRCVCETTFMVVDVLDIEVGCYV